MDYSFDYDRINNSYFGVATNRDGLSKQMIHDVADHATMNRNHLNVVDLKRSVGRDKNNYLRPVGVPEGPHDNRFNRDDTFDKSNFLSRNVNTSMTLKFDRQVKRRADQIIKGGDVTIDIKGRSHNVYDGVMKKDVLTMAKLTNGILSQSKHSPRKDEMYRNDGTEASFDQVKAADSLEKTKYKKQVAFVDLNKRKKREFRDLVSGTEAFKNIERENKHH